MIKRLLFVGALAALGIACGGDDDEICDKFAAWANKCEPGAVSSSGLRECKEGFASATVACRNAGAAYMNCATKISCESVKENSCQAESDKAESVCDE